MNLEDELKECEALIKEDHLSTAVPKLAAIALYLNEFVDYVLLVYQNIDLLHDGDVREARRLIASAITARVGKDENSATDYLQEVEKLAMERYANIRQGKDDKDKFCADSLVNIERKKKLAVEIMTPPVISPGVSEYDAEHEYELYRRVKQESAKNIVHNEYFFLSIKNFLHGRITYYKATLILMCEKNNTLELSRKQPEDSKSITIGTVHNSVIGDNNGQFSQVTKNEAPEIKKSFLHTLFESIIIKIIAWMLALLGAAIALIWGIKLS